MNIEIRYFSRTGHTKTMARTVASVLGKTARSLDVPLGEEKVDILLLGTSVYYAGVDKAVKKFISTLTPDKVGKVICFGSAGIIDSSYAQVKGLLQKQGVNVDDREFHCRGEMFKIHAGHPDEKDLADLKAWTEGLSLL